MIEVEHHAALDTWSVFDEATLCIGYGNTRREALDDYRDNCAECLDRLVELGEHHVAPHLWATVPALREALALSIDP
jgi:hypothetical protein